jgi:hypothetical protein
MIQRDGSFVTSAGDVTKEPSLCVIITPLTIDTVRQSIAKAIARRIISIRLIQGTKIAQIRRKTKENTKKVAIGQYNQSIATNVFSYLLIYQPGF